MAALLPATARGAASLLVAALALMPGASTQPSAAVPGPGIAWVICTSGAVDRGGATYPRSPRARLTHLRQNAQTPAAPVPPRPSRLQSDPGAE